MAGYHGGANHPDFLLVPRLRGHLAFSSTASGSLFKYWSWGGAASEDDMTMHTTFLCPLGRLGFVLVLVGAIPGVCQQTKPMKPKLPAAASRPLGETKPDFDPAALAKAKAGEKNLRGVNLRRANLAQVDLRGVDLRGADLSFAILREVDLGGANLTGAEAMGVNLRGARLEKTDLTGANLTEASLRDARLVDTVLVRATLARAQAQGSYFEKGTWGNANLEGAVLASARFARVTFDGDRFVGANLHMASFAWCGGKGATFAGADLTKAQLQSNNFSHFVFSKAQLQESRLSSLTLEGGSFAGANLTGASLEEIRAHGGTFNQARMAKLQGRRLVFTAVDLSEVSFQDGFLAQAKFSQCEFGLTDFSRAMFSDNGAFRYSDLSRANLSGTVLPEGFEFTQCKVNLKFKPHLKAMKVTGFGAIEWVE